MFREKVINLFKYYSNFVMSFFCFQDKDDLRNEIFSLKVQLNNVKNENCLLKVKVRKLQEEIVKKNKHIEVLLNPKRVIQLNIRVFVFLLLIFVYSQALFIK